MGEAMTSGGARIAGKGKKIGRPKVPERTAMTFKLPPEVKAKLEKLAKWHGISQAQMVFRAIMQAK